MHTTKTSFRLIRVAFAACASLVLVSGLASPALGDSGERNVVAPRAYYLSVGDSMGFGLQFDRLFEMLDAGTYTPDAFDTGYTDVLAARMRRLRPDQQVVNLSCPGESTETMIKGGCEFKLPEPEGPGLALHVDYDSSQLDAAVSFLRSHRRHVSPITVTIGGIDAGSTFADTCNFDATCIERSGLRDRLERRLDRILGTLRAAAPDTEIVLVVFYNPFSISNPETDRLWRRHYAAVEKDVARRNDVRVADVSEIVNGNNICQLTFLCGSGDSHPTDAGYRRIANRIFDVVDYRAAGHQHLRAGREEDPVDGAQRGRPVRREEPPGGGVDQRHPPEGLLPGPEVDGGRVGRQPARRVRRERVQPRPKHVRGCRLRRHARALFAQPYRYGSEGRAEHARRERLRQLG